jgi:hypothetical protein
MPISTTPADKQGPFKDALWYAAAAGAVAGLAMPAQAQIVYNDLDPDVEVQDTYTNFDVLPINGLEIDFDGDGDNVLIFAERDDTTYPSAYVLNGAEAEEDAPGDAVTAIAGNLIDFNGTDYAYWLPLEAGSTISSGFATLPIGGTSYALATFTFGGSDPNGWVGVGDRYIGLQFQLEEGTTHYAWVRVEIPEPGLLIVKDYAFNATPDEPIEAGAMGTLSNEAGPLEGSHRLSAAYPNPFNVDARFELEVARTQDVRVEVFDVLGRSVQVLHEGALTAGTNHEFAIRGAELPNGVYLVRAAGEEFKETRTVTLAR